MERERGGRGDVVEEAESVAAFPARVMAGRTYEGEGVASFVLQQGSEETQSGAQTRPGRGPGAPAEVDRVQAPREIGRVVFAGVLETLESFGTPALTILAQLSLSAVPFGRNMTTAVHQDDCSMSQEAWETGTASIPADAFLTYVLVSDCFGRRAPGLNAKPPGLRSKKSSDRPPAKLGRGRDAVALEWAEGRWSESGRLGGRGIVVEGRRGSGRVAADIRRGGWSSGVPNVRG